MHEKPAVVKTHLRNMIIMPEMIGSVVGVYNGKTYIGVEIKAEMVSIAWRTLRKLSPRSLLSSYVHARILAHVVAVRLQCRAPLWPCACVCVKRVPISR